MREKGGYGSACVCFYGAGEGLAVFDGRGYTVVRGPLSVNQIGKSVKSCPLMATC